MVTVIITTCKRPPEVLERAIKSVIMQTYRHWELMVIDDSPDSYQYRSNVRETVLKYAEKYPVSYHANEVNSGACYSRNIGLSGVTSEYVAYLDDDDEWMPEKLEKQVEVLDHASETVALVYCYNYRIVEGTPGKKLITRPSRHGNIYKDLLNKGNFVGGMSIPLLRTECVKNVGGFDRLMQSAQDMDLWLRLSKEYDFVLIEVPLVINHWYSGERISNNPAKRIAGVERLMAKNKEFLDHHCYIRWKKQISICQYQTQLGQKSEAMQMWRQAVKSWPIGIVRNAYELLRICKCEDNGNKQE